ncbi:MAG: MarR family transcriptional regulator, partial [Acidimicrobiales bacterium]|nr:MarR family transcriptional regulator [Acidimicrobiales bacterium]
MSTAHHEPAPWLDAREARAWRGFMTMQGKVRRSIAQHLQREAGLSEADYEVLVHLSEADGGRMRAVELGAATQWEKSRLFHQITRMHGRGLVTKESCGNARHAHVALTEKG